VRHLYHGLQKFFFAATSDTWLSILRFGLGLQVIVYCISIRGDWNELLATNGSGFISRELAEAILSANSFLIPRVGWLTSLLHLLGIGEQAALSLTWASLLLAGLFLSAGLFSRVSSIFAWFLYLCAAKSGALAAYGADQMTIIGLFYLMVSPLPDRFSLDHRLRKYPIKDAWLHGFFRRVLQLHLCVIYFSSGVTKCLGAGWWNGASMWRALTRPPFNIIPVDIILSGRALLPVVGIAILVLETGYPLFIWVNRTRFIWLIAILCMHLAIGLTMGLYLFSLIMIVLNLAAFGSEYLFRTSNSEESVSAQEV